MTKDQRSAPEVLDETSLRAISEAIKAREPSRERREAMRSRILARIKEAPAPAGTTTIRAKEGEWITITSLVKMKILRRDRVHNNQTAFWRLKPGAVVPAHPHSQEEECLVLEGEIKIGDHYVRQGDMHIALPGYAHPPIESERGALLLVRAEIGDSPMAGGTAR